MPGCNKKTNSTNGTELTQGTEVSSMIKYDGKYTGNFSYHGEKITSTSIVKNGEVESTTYINEKGEPIYPEDIVTVLSSFNEKAAQEFFIENFDKYPCLLYTVSEKTEVVGGESGRMYTILGGPSEKNGGCWYD